MLKIEIDFNLILLFIILILIFIIILYAICDLNYFIRAFITIWYCNLNSKFYHIYEETNTYGICTTQDLDVLFDHMNNARYIRELDFARIYFFKITGLYDLINSKNGFALQSATNIRYRRPISLLVPFKVTTKMVYWDEKAIYLEHNFITLRDKFVCATVLSKQAVIGVNMSIIMKELLNENTEETKQITSELEDWMKLLEKSSAKLKKKEL